MAKIEIGDICNPGTEAIISPSNKLGIVEKGLAKKIAESAGKKIYKECRDNTKKQNFFKTSSGKIRKNGVKMIYHAILCDFPGEIIDDNKVIDCLRDILKDAVNNNIKTISIPKFFNTEIGLMAGRLVQVANEFEPKISIFFIDEDENFIRELGKFCK